MGEMDINKLLDFIGTRRETISLHFSDVRIRFPAVLGFLQCLAASPRTTGSVLISSFFSDLSSSSSSSSGFISNELGNRQSRKATTNSTGSTNMSKLQRPPLILAPAPSEVFPVAHRVSHLTQLRELSVDTDSFGSLGVALLFSAMKVCCVVCVCGCIYIYYNYAFFNAKFYFSFRTTTRSTF